MVTEEKKYDGIFRANYPEEILCNGCYQRVDVRKQKQLFWGLKKVPQGSLCPDCLAGMEVRDYPEEWVEGIRRGNAMGAFFDPPPEK